LTSNEEGRLDSWKEIAEYLGRDVHTCLRWEKEKGLPVHTIPGGKRRTVYAFKHEIDEWLAKSRVAEESEVQKVENLGLLGRVWQRIPAAGKAALLLLVFALAGFGTYFLIKETRAPVLTQLLQEGNRLVTISPNSSVAWTYDFPSSARILDSVVLPKRAFRRSPGVLVTVYLGEGKGDVLYFFSPRGEPLWQFTSDDTVSFVSGDFKLSWGFHLARLIEAAGETKVLLDTRQYTWWPSQLLLLNLRGEVEERFVNAGWINSAYLMKSPLGPVVVVGGVSNSHDGAFLAILDANHISGTSPEQAGTPYECRNCPAGRPLKYFVFPRSELNVVTGSLLYAGNGFPQGDIIPVVKPEVHGDLGQGPPESIYEFSLDFQLQRASYGDHYWEWHRKLEKEGKIKHSREQCPERNGPPRILQWEPKNGWQEIHPTQP
jgi:hypothetical protein